MRTVTAEGAAMELRHAEEAYPARAEVTTAMPPEAAVREGDVTYYGQPVVKEPVWVWSIPTYFFVGGLAGAAATIGAAAQAIAPRSSPRLIQGARWIAAGGTAVSAGLLIYDLGRPARFLNMLRVLRPSSPMSIGSWTLAASGAASGGAALLSRARGIPGRIGDAFGYAAGLLGLPLSGYTAVLLANTAIPIWREGRRTLPPLFIASAMASAGAVLPLFDLSEQERSAVHRFGVVGSVVELIAAASFAGDVSRVDPVGAPLRRGRSAALFGLAIAGGVLGLASSGATGRSRIGRSARALLGAAAGLAMRFALLEAGKASARDPRATLRLQRAVNGRRG